MVMGGVWPRIECQKETNASVYLWEISSNILPERTYTHTYTPHTNAYTLRRAHTSQHPPHRWGHLVSFTQGQKGRVALQGSLTLKKKKFGLSFLCEDFKVLILIINLTKQFFKVFFKMFLNVNGLRTEISGVLNCEGECCWHKGARDFWHAYVKGQPWRCGGSFAHKHHVLQWAISVFPCFCISSPLSVRRWTQYSHCWLLCSILAMYILRLWQMPIQRSHLTCSWWREVSVTSAWCQQRMWDWKESNCFHTNISGGMRMHTCMCAAGVSVFCLTPPPSLYNSSECSCDLWH